MQLSTRECGQCSLCCKLPALRELDKAHNTWCQHCQPGNARCLIYQDRPQSCRDFECLWRIKHEVPDFMYPLKSKIVLQGSVEGDSVIAMADSESAWKADKALRYLRHLSQRLSVVVVVGKKAYQVFPHGYRVIPDSEKKSDGFTVSYQLRENSHEIG